MSVLVKLAGRRIPEDRLNSDPPQSPDLADLSYEDYLWHVHVHETMTSSTFSASTTFGSDNDADDKDK
ncbi:MAG TPA: hypothetical protein VJZ71_05875 [Phycisphaerae bacterium]|nr:hypothetical protein [Phycisphaerae bacterium]